MDYITEHKHAHIYCNTKAICMNDDIRVILVVSIAGPGYCRFSIVIQCDYRTYSIDLYSICYLLRT